MNQRIEIGPFVFSSEGGWAKLSFTPDPAYVWSWPISQSPEPWDSIGEQIAKALALVDSRFEVRRHK